MSSHDLYALYQRKNASIIASVRTILLPTVLYLIFPESTNKWKELSKLLNMLLQRQKKMEKIWPWFFWITRHSHHLPSLEALLMVWRLQSFLPSHRNNLTPKLQIKGANLFWKKRQEERNCCSRKENYLNTCDNSFNKTHAYCSFMK